MDRHREMGGGRVNRRRHTLTSTGMPLNQEPPHATPADMKSTSSHGKRRYAQTKTSELNRHAGSLHVHQQASTLARNIPQTLACIDPETACHTDRSRDAAAQAGSCAGSLLVEPIQTSFSECLYHTLSSEDEASKPDCDVIVDSVWSVLALDLNLHIQQYEIRRLADDSGVYQYGQLLDMAFDFCMDR